MVQEFLRVPVHVTVLKDLAVVCRLKVTKRVQSELDKFVESSKYGDQQSAKSEQVLNACARVHGHLSVGE